MYLYNLSVNDKKGKILRIVNAFQSRRLQRLITLKTKRLACVRTRGNGMLYLDNTRSNLHHFITIDRKIGKGLDDILNHFTVIFDVEMLFTTKPPFALLRGFQQSDTTIHILSVDTFN